MRPVEIWRRWTSPTSEGEVARRREAVLLNVLAAMVVLSLLTQILQCWSFATTGNLAVVEWWLSNVAIGALFYGLLRLARAGRQRMAAGAVVVLTLGLGVFLLVVDGTDHPMWPTLVGLGVVLAGILLGGRGAMLALGAGAGVAIPVIALQRGGTLRPVFADAARDPTDAGDAVGLFAVLGVTAFICSVYVREGLSTIDVPLVRRHDAAIPPTPVRTGSLTVRELEVVRLVAGGMTNDDIAQRLVVSPRTVQAHVASAMRKTESSNRTVLGVLAVREGLVPFREPAPDDSAH